MSLKTVWMPAATSAGIRLKGRMASALSTIPTRLHSRTGCQDQLARLAPAAAAEVLRHWRHLRPHCYLRPRHWRRTASGVHEFQRGRQHALAGIAERVVEVVGSGAGGREAGGVVAEALLVDALELDREIGQAAVVPAAEAVGLAAGGRADQDHFDADAAQAVDDGFD